MSTRFLIPAPPRVLAHRGGVAGLPENTLESFRAAAALGVTHIETDVQVTRDDVAVLSHDPDLYRLTGRHDSIAQLTLAELQRIDLGGGARIPALDAVLRALPEIRFNIDIKTLGAGAPTARAVLAAGATERVLIASFSRRRRRRATSLLRGVATSATALEVATAVLLTGLRLAPLARAILGNVAAVQVPERMFGVRIITPRFITMVHSGSAEVHVWTVNDTESMNRFLEIGVDGLVTDDADLAIRLLASRRSSAPQTGHLSPEA